MEQMPDCYFPLILKLLIRDALIRVHVDMILGMRSLVEQVNVVVMYY